MLERIWVDINTFGGCIDSYNLYVGNENKLFNTPSLQALYLQRSTIWNNNTNNSINIELGIKQNWKNMRFLFLDNIFMQPYYFYDSILNGIGDSMTNLIFLKLWIIDEVFTWPQSLCNLYKKLKYLEMSLTGFDSIDSCIGNFNELEFFLVHTGDVQYIPLQLFNLPNIKILSLHGMTISWDTMIDIFYDNITNQFFSYNNNTLKELYLQLNGLCDTYTILSTNYTEYKIGWELIDMITEYNACENKCETEVLELFCAPFHKLSIY